MTSCSRSLFLSLCRSLFILLMGVVFLSLPGKAVAKKSSRSSSRISAKSAQKDYHLEILNLTSVINSIRTKAEFIETFAPGIHKKERAKMRRLLGRMKTLPRAYKRKGNAFLLVDGKSRFLVKLVDFEKSIISINGHHWAYNPKKSLISQLDGLALKLKKLGGTYNSFYTPLFASPAHAIAPLLYGAGYVTLVVGVRARQAYTAYKAIRAGLVVASPVITTVAKTATGGPSGGSGKRRSYIRDNEANKKKTAEAKRKAELKKFEDKYREEQKIKNRVDRENSSGLGRAGKTLGTVALGAGIALTSQMSITAVREAAENETTYGREMGCMFLGFTPFECKKLQVQIEKVDASKAPKVGAKTNLPCPSQRLPEFVSIKEVTLTSQNDTVEFKGKRIQIIKWIEGGGYLVQEHFAVPSTMLDEPSGSAESKQPKRDSLKAFDLNSTSLTKKPSQAQEITPRRFSFNETTKPIYLVETRLSKQYEFDKSGALQTIRKLGFDRPTLTLESEATTFPFHPSIVPNYSVPDSAQEAYFKQRQEWFEEQRDKSSEANPPINDPKEKEKSAELRERWEKAILAMDSLKDDFNKQCGDTKTSSDEPIQTGEEHGSQSTNN